MTMRDIVVYLFGEYERTVMTGAHSLYFTLPGFNMDGTESAYPQIFIDALVDCTWYCPDFEWFGRVILFSVCLWSFFRLIGCVVKRI